MTWILLLVCLLVAALFVVVFIRACMLRPQEENLSDRSALEGQEAFRNRGTIQEQDAGMTSEEEVAIQRFQAILRKRTVWPRQGKIDYAEFDAFLPLLRSLYPYFFEKVTVHLINERGIVLCWAGEQPSAQPIVLMAHYDVVGAEDLQWSYPPFAAEIHDGSVWARGAVDTKCILAALLEASAHLSAEGFKPQRDIYFSFSNNEETGGDTTPAIVNWFEEQGITPYLVLDEGGAVIEDPPLGVKKKFAMVGVAEKGSADLIITAAGEGGHSSTPSAQSSTVLLVSALHLIQHQPLRSELSPALVSMLEAIAAYASFGYRMVFANLWLFAPLVKKIMASQGETDAMIRTTIAVTQLGGSDMINTMPERAWAGLSVRILPGECVEGTVERIKAIMGDDVQIEVVYRREPPCVSDHRCAAFSLISDTIKTVYPEAAVAPYLMTGGTDSKHFASLCPHVYRFAGFDFTGEERAGVHVADEHLSVRAYLKGVKFYEQLLRAFNGIR